MAKRLKRVFTNHEQVLHLWANQAQTDARCKNVFFEKDTCYSYGYHYKLGKLHKRGAVTIAVINSRKYSNTTAKHQYSAYSAVEHIPRVYSSNVESIKTGVMETASKLVDLLSSYFNQRSFWNGDKNIDDAESYLFNQINELNTVCDFAKLPQFKIEVTKEYKELMWMHRLYCLQRDKERSTPEALEEKRLAREKRAEQAKVKFAARAQAWVRGEVPAFSELRALTPQLVRISGNEIETSRGARVLLADAVRFLHKLKHNKVKDGETIGNFTYSHSNPDGTIRIGCHTIDVEQAEKVLLAAPQLQVLQGGVA